MDYFSGNNSEQIVLDSDMYKNEGSFVVYNYMTIPQIKNSSQQTAQSFQSGISIMHY
jgi:hypothetical protein